MQNRRFLAILNGALKESGLDLSAPNPAVDPAVVAAWGRFLHGCAAQGVSLTDPRWRRLEVRSSQGHPRLFLAPASREAAGEGGEADFTLGLSLLISMLGDADDNPTD